MRPEMEQYRAVTENRIYTGEITEKKSRFISYLSFASSEEEAVAFVDTIRKKHHDARHNCSAYIIAGKGTSSDILHSSDDGEPSGTAGKPIMSVLEGAGIKNAVLVVTRYFGGVLLGTGGLVRAYTDAAKEAVSAAEGEIKTMGEFADISISFDYASEGKVRRLLDKKGVFPADADYSDKVRFLVHIPVWDEEDFRKQITELLSGAVTYEDRGRSVLCISGG